MDSMDPKGRPPDPRNLDSRLVGCRTYHRPELHGHYQIAADWSGACSNSGGTGVPHTLCRVPEYLVIEGKAKEPVYLYIRMTR
jgi:hypothetical protein